MFHDVKAYAIIPRMTVVITGKHTPEPIGAKVLNLKHDFGVTEYSDLTLARTGHS
jgi:hypothetical protein